MRTQTASFSYYHRLCEAAVTSSDAAATQLAGAFEATWSTGRDGPDTFEKCDRGAIDALCTRLAAIGVDVDTILRGS